MPLPQSTLSCLGYCTVTGSSTSCNSPLIHPPCCPQETCKAATLECKSDTFPLIRGKLYYSAAQGAIFLHSCLGTLLSCT